MRLDSRSINTLMRLQSEIGDVFDDSSIQREIEVDDDDGFDRLTLMVKFYSGKTVHLTFSLETGNLITGDDVCERVSGIAIWRQIAYELAVK